MQMQKFFHKCLQGDLTAKVLSLESFVLYSICNNIINSVYGIVYEALYYLATRSYIGNFIGLVRT